MTQTLKDSLSGVEILFDHIINIKKLSSDFSDGKKYGLWMTEVESEPEFKRYKGVDTKNNWIPVFIDLGSDVGYITIPSRLIPSEHELRKLYCDIAKRLGASDVFFNGQSLIRRSEE